jgi:hypothetical protein
VAPFHDRWRNADSPPTFGFFRQIDKGTGIASDLLQLCVDGCQAFFGKAGPDSAGKHKPVRTIVANQQRAKVFPASFRESVPADYELLGLGDLVLDPGTTTPAALVNRIQSFGDQPFEAKLLRDVKQVLFGTLQAFRDPDVWRRLFESVSQ